MSYYSSEMNAPAAMVTVTIKILPFSKEISVDIPLNATAKDVINQLLTAGLEIPVYDGEGNRISYMLIPNGIDEQIDEDRTIGSVQVQNGDTLLLTPKFNAGGIAR